MVVKRSRNERSCSSRMTAVLVVGTTRSACVRSALMKVVGVMPAFVKYRRSAGRCRDRAQFIQCRLFHVRPSREVGISERWNAARRETGQVPCSILSLQSHSQLFVHISAVTDGHEANHARLAINGIDDSKAANAILPQPIEFTLERLSTLGVGRNGTNRSFDGAFQVRMKRPDDLSHVRRDVRTEVSHAVRRFLTGVSGSPNTSSKVRPFLPDR